MGAAGAYAQAGVPFSYYWSVLRRYRNRILAFVLLVSAAATLVALALPKQYAATATLRIDPAGNHTVGDENSNSSSNVSVSALALITTEANEVSSSAVVLQTINDLQLYKNTEFAPVKAAGRGGALSAAGMNEVLRHVTRAISVSQPLETYLLQVSFRSRDPQLSADTANDLLHSLIQHDYETRVQALTGSSKSMRSQLTDLQAKMESSQEALVEYESSHDVLNPDSSDNIIQARLSQVNRDLGQAQTQRMALQADYEVVKQGNLDALVASDRGRYLLPLQQQLLDDQRTLSRMAQTYGPNYPVYRQQEAVVRNDQQVLLAQEKHIGVQIASEYAMGLAREKLLQGELNLQKKRMDAFNLKAIRYNSLKAASDAYTKLYYELQQSIQDSTVAANVHAESLRVISPARPIQRPVYPRPLLVAGLSLLFSSLLGIAAALGFEILDRSLSTPEQVEQLFALHVLSALPLVAGRDLVQLTPLGYGAKLLGHGQLEEAERRGDGDAGIASPFSESVLGLHSALMLMRERDLRVLAVTSSVPGEGKTTVACNLAAAFAGLSGRTVLIDADMRKPGVHRQFQVSNRRGLSALLRGQCRLDQVLVEAPGVPNLTLLPGGSMPSSPAQLLHLGLEDLLEQLRARFEYIIIDCPPVLGFADALTPANLADGCVLVVRAGGTERQLVTGALRQLRSARTEILGIVLNSVSQRPGTYYSYYSHYYQYRHDGGGNSAEEVDVD